MTYMMHSTPIHKMVIGISTFHPKDINWSYRYLGNDALNQIKTNKKNSVFNSNQNMLGSVKNENTDDSKNGMPAKKLSQPPRNIIDVSTDMRAILMYSARKILQTQSQNINMEPAIISASPS